MSTEAELRVRERQERQRERMAFLERRIPELHRAGVKGRLARRQADMEWGQQIK